MEDPPSNVVQNGEDAVSSNNISNDKQLTSTTKNVCDSDDEKEVSVSRRIRLKQFSDSDSDGTKKENDITKSNLSNNEHDILKKSDSDSASDNNIFDSKRKSRIKIAQSGSESDSHSEKGDIVSPKRYELTRIKIKNKKLRDKFKQFKNAGKNSKREAHAIESHPEPSSDVNSNEESQDSDEGESCLKIKQKIKRKSVPFKPSVCDPDTSDEENTLNIKEQKSRPGSTKLTSPKPMRMTAKQAMENMQKIKSESNRMLREKEVSLPYHRPKALSLKDIMNRRKPAVTSDGKTLPIKMNNEQLKQYALLLEERQKEMMELCKSDTSEEEENMSETKLPLNGEQQPKNCEESIVNDIKLDNKSAYLQSAHNDKVGDDKDVAENTDKLDVHDDEGIHIVEEPKADAEMITVETFLEVLDQSENTNKCHKEEKTNTMETDDLTQNKFVCINDTNTNKGIEDDSQIISLHYDTEKNDIMEVTDNVENEVPCNKKIIDEVIQISFIGANEEKDNSSNNFSDNDFTKEELDNIENFEIPKETFDKPLPAFESTLDLKPKLTGGPGMVIDLDFSDSGCRTQKKLTGVEMLKERYVYFAKLQCQEDIEKDREKKYKPGTQHFQLKQELEEQIAEQRSLEWAKRLEEENKLKAEINAGGDDEIDDIERIEAKLEDNELENEKEDSSSEEEEVEDMDICDLKEKQRERNPMIDDEAEVSDDEDYDEGNDNTVKNAGCNEVNDNDNSDDIESEEDDDSSESEEEEEEQAKPRKGRILKAFEDSDDEDSKKEGDPVYTDHTVSEKFPADHHDILESQDDELQLAQLHKSYSEDLFTSQSSNVIDKDKDADTSLENDLGTQTFSIAKAINTNINLETERSFPEKLDVICETQPCNEDKFDAIVGMCSGSFSQNFVAPQIDSSQLSQSQEIGDDVLALCTGEFYNNPLVSQTENENLDTSKNDSANASLNVSDVDLHNDTANISNVELKSDDNNGKDKVVDNQSAIKDNTVENKLLKSILDELDDPEFDAPKPNKYFFNSNKSQNKDVPNIDDSQPKRKLVIESDDEMSENTSNNDKKKKKRKKHKLERRALQISDDEEEDEEEIYESEIEEDGDREVEYDSEENEVEVKIKVVKKKRVGRDFFEQEAELTSEDEWMGSGDEDEAGLDRMEREEGDDDTFHQGQLQKELGQIHMRDVLDQDKREVRLLQELLFEDGDLGDGHRQRKFRWKNADGEEETGTNVDEYMDTQEEEFESEEQWRKQRHEREMFLRKMQEQEEGCVNISINRSNIIKASLCPKPTPSLPPGNNASNAEKLISPPDTEKKTKDIPSPKKPFVMFQQNYHNSLLTRGRGALARLAALATPLAGDSDDGPKVIASSNRGNFVFAAITPDDAAPKVIKRKADSNPGTPRLLKKMRVDETNKFSKNSLLDHL